MRRFPVAFAILILIILSCSLSLVYINAQKNSLYSTLDNAYSSAISGDVAASQKHVNDFIKNWKNNEKFLKLVIHRKDLEDISFTAEVMSEYIKAQEIPEFCAETKRIMALVSHIWETEVPLFSNII